MRTFLVWLLAFQLVVPCYSSDYGGPLQEAGRVERDILNGKLADRTEKALDRMFLIAGSELRKRGYISEAYQLSLEWNETYRTSFRNYAAGMRDIGDHKPLNEWIAEKYQMIELVLGVDVCKAMHLSDIKTLNYAIPVVFRPCSFPMDFVDGERSDEYVRHFNEGAVYFGLFPVVVYWSVYIGCTVGTAGTGFILVCGLAGGLGERLSSIIGDNLGEKIYDRACGNQ